MQFQDLNAPAQAAVQDVLGYLNFSSGAADPRFRRGLDLVFGCCQAAHGGVSGGGAASGNPAVPTAASAEPAEAARDAGEATWRVVARLLRERLEEVSGNEGPFRQVEQARAVLPLVFEQVLPAYLEFHRDLLFHQHEEVLFGPFFVACVFEKVLANRSAEGEPTAGRATVAETLRRLNDFLGHRPVAVLRSEQKIAPYAHEYVRPVPLYLAGAGVAGGSYHELVAQAWEILIATDTEVLESAYFEPALVEELAFDPRAYDFDHPVNKRPNYHFGQWDPHHLDSQGRYRRFVWQQVTLDLLLSRVQAASDIPRSERLWEAGAVLAGVTLMASLTSGRGPETHDSSVTLSTLMPRIARLRDQYYDRLLQRLDGSMAERLRKEARDLRQPLGGARQHLNQSLARLRARQQQHAVLARLLARMGYPQASLRQAQVVPVASARMACEFDCRIVSAHHAIDRGDLRGAAVHLPELEDLLERGIQCGAMVDPWNVLGFQGQFSLFAAVENSVHDHRVEELVRMVSRLFALYARLQSEAAAEGDRSLLATLDDGLERRAGWWDRFATTDVSSVQSVSGQEACASAASVAEALGAWHEAGAQAGQVAFWRQHVDKFESPKAYALVIDALLDKGDYVAAMALLMQWLSRAEEIGLVSAEHAFFERALRWMREVWSAPERTSPAMVAADVVPGARPLSPLDTVSDPWALTTKFFDYLEANAEDFWQVPRFDESARRRQRPPRPAPSERPDEAEDEEGEEAGGLFDAAYEDVTFRDTASDGQEGDILDAGGTETDYVLDYEGPRLAARLAFLATLARLWRMSVEPKQREDRPSDWETRLRAWYEQAHQNRVALERLLEEIQAHRLPAPLGTHDSMMEYDRRRSLKQGLAERTLLAQVETADAARLLLAAGAGDPSPGELPDWERATIAVLQAVVRGERRRVREFLPLLTAKLVDQPLLYVPLSRGGGSRAIVTVQSLELVLRQLMFALPRLGMLNETVQLLAMAREMERKHAVGPGALTEFDQLFQVAFKSIVHCILDSSRHWSGGRARRKQRADEKRSTTGGASGQDEELLECLQVVTEHLLEHWLAHSKLIRLSVLEKVASDADWQLLRGLIEAYGQDLFTPRFLNAGNLRAILDQGVEAYLGRLDDLADDAARPRLLDDLGTRLDRTETLRQVQIIIEAVLENYVEYRDFNSTTTQSDHGEMLFVLLDFLRLKVRYERVCWNLRPVVLAHQMLVRDGRTAAAAEWRQMVGQRTAEVAQWHLDRMAELEREYGIQLPTVVDRFEERFVRPLELDRIRALVRPAMEDARRGRTSPAFEELEQLLGDFTRRPTGSGLDTPAWLSQLSAEVEQVESGVDVPRPEYDILARIPQTCLSLEEVREQLRGWRSTTADDDA